MKLAVFSDIHNNIANLDWSFTEIEKAQPDAIICCGDFSSVETLKFIANKGYETYFCLGNMDEEQKDLLKTTADANEHLHMSLRAGRLDLDESRWIEFTHYPDVAFQIVNHGGPIAVFYGHTHRRHAEMLAARENIPPCLLANPGDLENRHSEGASLLLWDSDSGEHKFIIK